MIKKTTAENITTDDWFKITKPCCDFSSSLDTWRQVSAVLREMSYGHEDGCSCRWGRGNQNPAVRTDKPNPQTHFFPGQKEGPHLHQVLSTPRAARRAVAVRWSVLPTRWIWTATPAMAVRWDQKLQSKLAKLSCNMKHEEIIDSSWISAEFRQPWLWRMTSNSATFSHSFLWSTGGPWRWPVILAPLPTRPGGWNTRRATGSFSSCCEPFPYSNHLMKPTF